MLKRIMTFMIILAVLVCFYLFNNPPIFNSYAQDFEVYLSDGSSNAQIVSVNRWEYVFLSGIKGESIKLEKERFDLEKFIYDSRAQIVMEEDLIGVKNIYAFSNNIKYVKTIRGIKVNIHIAISPEQVTIGSPIIFGSF